MEDERPGLWRWRVVGFFLGFAAASFGAAAAERNDPTALQIWLGVGLSLITAGLVDLFNLIEARRQARFVAARMEPVQAMILTAARMQRGELLRLVQFVTGEDVSDGLEEFATRLRALGPGLLQADDPVPTFPPSTRGAEAAHLIRRLEERQHVLAGLASTGYMSSQIEALSRLTLSGSFMALAKAILLVPARRPGVGVQAAHLVDDLRMIDIPAE